MAAQHILLSGTDRQVDTAVEAVRRGAVVVLPTETVYGFAISPGLGGSGRVVRELKGRPAHQSLTHHLSAREDLEAVAGRPPERVERLLERFWPGPLTVILEGLGEPTVRR